MAVLTYTDRAKRVLQIANTEAQNLNHEYIGTEHIFFGLVKEGLSVAANVLGDMGIRDKMVEALRKAIAPGVPIVMIGKSPQTPRAKLVMESATRWAVNLNHKFIGPEHILLGLMEHDSAVCASLEGTGVSADDVKKRVLQYVGTAKFDSDAETKLFKEPLTLASIPQILRVVMDGKWVRMVNGVLQVRDD